MVSRNDKVEIGHSDCFQCGSSEGEFAFSFMGGLTNIEFFGEERAGVPVRNRDRSLHLHAVLSCHGQFPPLGR